MKQPVEVYCGDGKGKTSSAIGTCVKAAGQSKQVIIIQFLKGKDGDELDFMKRLEPEVQIFRFEKYDKQYMDLDSEEKKEQDHLIFNGLKYAKKVIDTRQCDVLVLDEILGVLDLGIVGTQDILELLEGRDEELHVIMTGRMIPDAIKDVADNVYCIDVVKE